MLGVAEEADRIVTTVLADGGEYTIESRYLVGADGARSTVRSAVGIGFPGTEATSWGFLGDVHLDEPPNSPVLSRDGELGGIMVVPLPKSELHRIVGRSTRLTHAAELTFEVFRAMVTEIAGTDFGMRDPYWLSMYGDAARIATSYRAGRTFIAGDAAHIHLPAGGVGMNVGIQDAANLAWRLADVLQGYAPDSVLDDYNAERRPVGLDLLVSTQAQAAVQNFSPDGLALRRLISRLIATLPDFSRALAERLCGFSVSYHEEGDSHRLTGVRAPDLKLGGAQSLFAALVPADPVLLTRRGSSTRTSAVSHSARRRRSRNCPTSGSAPSGGTSRPR